jgi:lipoate-protein ligase B
VAERLQFHFLGLLNFDGGLEAQEQACLTLRRGEADAVVLGLEHAPVVTLGIRGRIETDLQFDESYLRHNGVQLRAIGRGGQATLHSPGQLVIYPCVNLRAFGLGARSYVQLIEATTLTWLRSLGIQAQTGANEPGLFVAGKKIAAFGFQISHGLTSHGLAVNVSNDLGLFELIRTCGVAGQPVAKLSDFGVHSGLEALFLSWLGCFRENLQAIAVDVTRPGPLL